MRVWIRILGGYGLAITSGDQMMSFSVRYGHKHAWRLGPWVVEFLKPDARCGLLKWWRIYWHYARY